MNDWVSQEALLIEGYRQCARLTWRYGTTYFWGAALLPRPQRKHVYAVYALCRLADDIVDLPNGQHAMRPEPVEGRKPEASTSSARNSHDSDASTNSAHLRVDGPPTGPPVDKLIRRFGPAHNVRRVLPHQPGGRRQHDPVMAAVVHTVITRRIDPECFDRFFDAMAMDLTKTSYQTWEDLRGYMEGSAAVIGEMMLPVLEPHQPGRRRHPRGHSGWRSSSPTSSATSTRILIAVGSTCRRRICGSSMLILNAAPLTPEWRAFLAYEIERNRALYSFADTGIAMLPPRSARCVGTARVLYAQILDRIERNGYDVFSGRARVPTSRKAATAARIMVTGPRALQEASGGVPAKEHDDVTPDTY